MTGSLGHRIRWIAVWSAIALWFVATALRWFGDWAHLLLVAAFVLVVYELLVRGPENEDGPAAT
ncbi:MAG: hypothetical protein FJ034_02050 [Chloroflexi bacterium]|nr:hypothetical protein [Chloroflexota bacterium]